MSAGKLIKAAAVAYLGYLFWTEFDRVRKESGKRAGNLDNFIPNLQTGGSIFAPDGQKYQSVTQE